MYHQIVKFPIPWGIQQIRGDQDLVKECYKTCLKPTVQRHEMSRSQSVMTSTHKAVRASSNTGDMQNIIEQDGSTRVESNFIGYTQEEDIAIELELERQTSWNYGMVMSFGIKNIRATSNPTYDPVVHDNSGESITNHPKSDNDTKKTPLREQTLSIQGKDTNEQAGRAGIVKNYTMKLSNSNKQYVLYYISVICILAIFMGFSTQSLDNPPRRDVYHCFTKKEEIIAISSMLNVFEYELGIEPKNSSMLFFDRKPRQMDKLIKSSILLKSQVMADFVAKFHSKLFIAREWLGKSKVGSHEDRTREAIHGYNSERCRNKTRTHPEIATRGHHGIHHE
ncbi:hypothetical protein POM88_038456 [Heracleum sosnowskyi]|uniref:Uncharacterized protein n=1 Tax=Heracleum sosnowskyi TaxID=360622 RepID=A0AAD8M5G6_9APIA|nr:hypothetical protein POM88_038456 [Heracleum sosnowskyi]